MSGEAPDISLGDSESGLEEDVCRVCRVEADEGHPMMHPCKCSGSVKFVHSDCLKSWLATSQKKYCEICGHRYTFTKVYPEYLPTVIPAVVYVRQSVLYILRLVLSIGRGILVAACWLVLLPAFNMAALRTLFHLSDQFLKGMSYFAGGPTPAAAGSALMTILEAALPIDSAVNSTSALLAELRDNETVKPELKNPKGGIFYQLVLGLSSLRRADIMKTLNDSFLPFVLRGQILSLCLAGLIIAIIFLREWMTQHNWAQHDEEQKTLPEIDPDEWMIMAGVATKIVKQPKERRHRSADSSPTRNRQPVSLEELLKTTVVTKLPKEALERRIDGNKIESKQDAIEAIQWMAEGSRGRIGIPRSESEPARPSSWSLAADIAATTDESTEPTAPPKVEEKKISLVDFLQDSPVRASARDAEAGPGPTTLANRRNSASRSSQGDLQEQEEVKEQRLEAARRALSQNDVAWQAPELLRRGDSSRATGQDAEEADIKPFPPPDMTDFEVLLRDLESFAAKHPEANANDPVAGVEPEGNGVPQSGAENGLDEARPNDNAPDPARADRRVEERDRLRRALRAMPPVPPIPPVDNGRILIRRRRRMGQMPEDDEDEWEDVDPDPNAPLELVARAPPAEDAPVLDDMDMEGGWEWDDVEGLLEVVGLIGPITNLGQNIVLAVIFMSATLALLVDLPMTIGKLFLLVDLIWAFAHTGKLVYKGLRFIADPLFDIAFDLARAGFYRPSATCISAARHFVTGKIPVWSARTAFSFPLVEFGSSSLSRKVLNPIIALAKRKDTFERIGDIFALIGRRAFHLYEAYRKASLELVASDEIIDRSICVLVGYATSMAVMAAIAIASGASFGKGAQGVAGQVRVHALFAKLCFFMALELAAFPLATGFAISLCVVPMFPGATIKGRVAEIMEAPFGNLFICWLCGTSFMYTFAQGLNWLRSLTRPGGLYFIRDPHDPKFSPVKDIIERPVWNQLRKLWTSGVLYGFLVWCIFGAGCWTLAYQPYLPIFPLRTDAYGPLSSTPFDLIFLLVALPQTTTTVDLRAWIKRAIGVYWRYTPYFFHLDSLVHGKPATLDARSESPAVRILYTVIDAIFQAAFGRYSAKATFARVPAQDQVVLLARLGDRGGVFVPVNEYGEPQTPEDKLRILKQNAAALGEERNPVQDYIVLWLPQWWRTRVHLFVILTAIMAGVGVMAMLLAPLLVGRGITGVFFGDVHDGYNLLAGFYILQFLLSTGRHLRGIVIALNHAKPYNPFRQIGFTRYKGKTIRAARSLYSCFVLFCVLPMLKGLLLEIRVGLLVRYGLRNSASVIHLWDSWAMGAVMLALEVKWDRYKTGGRVHLPPTPRERLRGMYESPLTVRMHRLHQVVGPMVGRMILALLYTFVLATGASLLVTKSQGMWENRNEIRTINFRLAGPSTWLVSLLFSNYRALLSRISTLKQSMIDAEYVVEERVENYEGPSQEEEAAAESLAKGLGSPPAAEIAEVLREGGEILVDVQRPGQVDGRGEVRIEVGAGGRMEVWQEFLPEVDVEEAPPVDPDASEGDWEDTDQD